MQVDIRKFKGFTAFKDRFLSKVPKEYFTKEYDNKCWDWMGCKNNGNYGLIWWGERSYKAHRISYIIFNDIIPYNKVIRHKCDNNSCINPKHLVIGTQSDNSIDMVKRNPRSNIYLNEEAVKVIKWMLKYNNYYGLTKKLAKLYNVNQATISMIKNNKRWSWITV